MTETENITENITCLHPPAILCNLFKLINLEQKKDYTFTDIEIFVGYKNPQPMFRKLLNILKDNQVLIVSSEMYGIYRYRLVRKKLLTFINELEISKLYYNYFKDNFLLLI